jgi:hypothetical protein
MEHEPEQFGRTLAQISTPTATAEEGVRQWALRITTKTAGDIEVSYSRKYSEKPNCNL